MRSVASSVPPPKSTRRLFLFTCCGTKSWFAGTTKKSRMVGAFYDSAKCGLHCTRRKVATSGSCEKDNVLGSNESASSSVSPPSACEYGSAPSNPGKTRACVPRHEGHQREEKRLKLTSHDIHCVRAGAKAMLAETTHLRFPIALDGKFKAPPNSKIIASPVQHTRVGQGAQACERNKMSQ